MASVNKVILVGNIGRDPEIRSTQNGKEIANLTVATSERWRDKNTGEQKEQTEWHRVAVFTPGLVDVCKKYLKKGAKVYVEGSLQTREWTDKEGTKRYQTEVVLQAFNGTLTMLDGKQPRDPRLEDDEADRELESREDSLVKAAYGGGKPTPLPDMEMNDDIPF